jgi:hypothetical protein
MTGREKGKEKVEKGGKKRERKGNYKICDIILSLGKLSSTSTESDELGWVFFVVTLLYL